MTKRMQKVGRPRLIEEELNRLFPPDLLREMAKETGFVKRERKIDPALMFWSLTLGFGVQLQRTLHWSSVKEIELLNISFFHTNYALHKRDPISIMACCNLFDQANLAGLATGIAASSRFLP